MRTLEFSLGCYSERWRAEQSRAVIGSYLCFQGGFGCYRRLTAAGNHQKPGDSLRNPG